MRFIFLILFGIGVLVGGQAEAKSTEFQAGTWPGRIVFDDESGAFSRCYIYSDYYKNIRLFFQIDHDKTFHVALAHPDWTLRIGDSYDVVLEVDSVLHQSYDAYAYATGAVDITFMSPGGLLDILRYGRTLRVYAQKDVFVFELSGTKKALKKLYDCYRDNAPANTASNPN